jgi:hypothetical protein
MFSGFGFAAGLPENLANGPRARAFFLGTTDSPIQKRHEFGQSLIIRFRHVPKGAIKNVVFDRLAMRQ